MATDGDDVMPVVTAVGVVGGVKGRAATDGDENDNPDGAAPDVGLSVVTGFW
jgi:hypothetical protein